MFNLSYSDFYLEAEDGGDNDDIETPSFPISSIIPPLTSSM